MGYATPTPTHARDTTHIPGDHFKRSHIIFASLLDTLDHMSYIPYQSTTGANRMMNKPITALPGVVTYRCERPMAPHPRNTSADQLSVFYVDDKGTADQYARIDGWKVTALGRYIPAKEQQAPVGFRIAQPLPVVVLLTEQGLSRVLQGEVGMSFFVDCYTGTHYNRVAHVRDYRYMSNGKPQIWSLGVDDWATP